MDKLARRSGIMRTARQILASVAFAWALFLAGCEASEVDRPSDRCGRQPDPSRCLSEYYFAVPPEVIAACAPGDSSASLDATLTMELYRGVGETDEAVALEGGRLARFFSPYGLRFATAHPAEDAGLRYAMSGSEAELSAALDAAEIPRDRDLTPEESVAAHRALGDVLFADLRAFVARQSAERGGVSNVVDLVVVEHVLAPDLARAFFGGSDAYIAGLGVSPRFLENLAPDDPDRALADMLGLPEAFTPVALVGAEDTVRVTGSLDNLVAHEVGHALGLPHVVAADNLLQSGPAPDCEATLSAAQLDELRPALAREESALVAGIAPRPITPVTLESAILLRWAGR